MSHRKVEVRAPNTEYLVIGVGAIALLHILTGSVETLIVVMATVAIIVPTSVGLNWVDDILTEGRRTAH